MATKTKTTSKTKTAPKRTTKKKTTAAKNTAKSATKKTTKAIKAKTKNITPSDVFNVVAKFFKQLNPAYYVGALAVFATFLFFSPWLNVAILEKLCSMFNITFIPTEFVLPSMFMSFGFGLDKMFTPVIGFLNVIDPTQFDGSRLAQATTTINTAAALLHVNLADYGINLNDIVASVQQLLPTGEKVAEAKELLSMISGLGKAFSFTAMIVALVVVGFNLYTVIITFAKKKITKICLVAFIIEGALSLLFIIACALVNSVVHSIAFFLPDFIAATGWCWLTLIVCVFSMIVCIRLRSNNK